MFFQTLKPDIISIVHSGRGIKGSEWFKLAFFAFLGIAFWIMIFSGVRYVLNSTLEIEILGEVLARKAYSLVFITFFIFLLLSNIITAFSTYFLADDLALLNHLPVGFDGFFASRFIITLLSSSWHIFIFGSPVFVAYGVALDAGWLFYLSTFLALIPFTMIPAAIAVIISHVLVSIFPAKRLKDIAVIIGIIAISAFLIYIRLIIQPERFIQPEGFANFSSFIAALDVPRSIWFPPDWFIQISYSQLQGSKPNDYFLLLLISTAFTLYFLANHFSRLVYSFAYSKAQEGKPVRKNRNRLIEILTVFSAAPYGRLNRSFIMKDTKLFMRDTAQWSQLLLIGGLVVIYVANAEHFKLITSTGIIGEREIFMLNILLIAFIVLSVAVRFIFPAVSQEGRAYWLIRVSPISLTQFLLSKFAVYFLPMLLLSLLFTALSFWIMGVSLIRTLLGIALITQLTLIATGMGVGLGALFPRFDIDNVAKIPASYGGIVYMLVCGGLMMLIITAFGVIFYISTSVGDLLAGSWSKYHTAVLVSGAALALSTYIGLVLPIQLGIKNLNNYE